MDVPIDIVCMLALISLVIGGVIGAIAANRTVEAEMDETFAFDRPAALAAQLARGREQRPMDLGPRQKAWCRDKWPSRLHATAGE